MSFFLFYISRLWLVRISNNSLWSDSSSGSEGSLAGSLPLAAIVTSVDCLPAGPVLGSFTMLLDLVFGGISLIIIFGEVFLSQ